MNLIRTTKISHLIALSSLAVGGVMLGAPAADAQDGSVITIDGQTSCTEQGVTATIEVVNPVPGLLAYFDVVLGDDVQYSNELAVGERESFEFLLPHQDFPATVSRGVMTPYLADSEDEIEPLPVEYRWPAVSCLGATPTTETPPTSAVSEYTDESITSTTVLETTTTELTTTTALVDERVDDSAGLEREHEAEHAYGTPTSDTLAYTGMSTGQIALVIMAVGIILLGAGAILVNPRPLRRS